MTKITEGTSKLRLAKSTKLNLRFGEKHKEYIRRARGSNMNVAEGAVRAGKTVNNVFAFAVELEFTPDRIHLATGSTLANAKLNIGEANGLGLTAIFRGRCRYGKFLNYECLYVNTATGEKIVIFAGGSKKNSFEKIRGNSYGMWIATEINLHHPTTIKECFDRLLMAINMKIYWDLNPEPPKHAIYTEYIDNYLAKSLAGKFSGGYNYENFTIYDNINLTEERISSIESMYDKGTVWYKRAILGQRVAAEGLVYETFAGKSSEYLIKVEDVPPLEKVSIGIDFGNAASQHSFVATGITKNYEQVIILASERWEPTITSEVLGQKYVSFLLRVEELFGYRVKYTYADSAVQTNIRDLKDSLRKSNLDRLVWNSSKLTINERVQKVSSLVNQGRLWHTEHAETARLALESCVWDPKHVGDKRLEDASTDIDTLDAFEYSFTRDFSRL